MFYPQFENIDVPLLTFGQGHNAAHWTMRQAFEGLFVCGNIGSGKSSTTGSMLAKKMLSGGWGGLVMCAKSSEAKDWEKFCAQTGRLGDLIIIGPRHKNYFNLLEYESRTTEHGKSITQNIVQTIQTVIEAGEEQTAGHGDDSFWVNALMLLLNNCVDLCLLAYGTLSAQALYDISTYAPSQGLDDDKKEKIKLNHFDKAFRKAQKNVEAKIEAWLKQRGGKTIEEEEDSDLYEEHIIDAVPDARLLQSVDDFFSVTYRNLHEKTKSIIFFKLQSFLFRLLRDPIYSLFCRYPSNTTPEDCFRGKIIVLDIPTKIFHHFGLQAQLMYKYIWQRAMERRDIAKNNRPVFLYMDESQVFMHPHDSDFQATARSSRVAVVSITQNISNLYANMGGQKFEHKVMSMLSTLSSKIFHCNTSVATNNFASELIGNGYLPDKSFGNSISEQFTASENMSFKLERMIRPEEFVSLSTGGPLNNYIVEAVMHVQGKGFKGGFNFKRLRFRQINNQ